MRNIPLRLLVIASLLLLVIPGCSRFSSTDDDSPIGEDAPTTSTADDETAASATGRADGSSEPDVETDYGVDPDTIRIGYSLDLVGPYSGHDIIVRSVHEAYFDAVNADGGVDGRQVEAVVLDNGFDVPLHLDNLSVLTEDSEAGVLAIGNLSHPRFGDASVSALGDSGIAAFTDLLPKEQASGNTAIVGVAGSICRETDAALVALAPPEGERRRLAIIGRDEAWAASSTEHARSRADELGFDVVLDVDRIDDVDAVVDQLLSIQPDVVWLAVSPQNVVSLSAALLPAAKSWRWAGASVAFDSEVLSSETVGELAAVYLHASASVPIDVASPTLQAELSEALPELTYGQAGTASQAWAQAEALHEALVAASGENDLTRANVARLAQATRDDSAVELYRLAPGAATLGRPLAEGGGGVGLIRADDLVVAAENLASCW